AEESAEARHESRQSSTGAAREAAPARAYLAAGAGSRLAERLLQHDLGDPLVDRAPRIVGAEDQAEVVRLQLGVREQAHQALRLEIRLNEVLREHRDALAAQDELADRRDGAHAEHLAEVQLRRAGAVAQVAEERQVRGDVDEGVAGGVLRPDQRGLPQELRRADEHVALLVQAHRVQLGVAEVGGGEDRKSTRLNSSHVKISYAVFCLKKKT